MEMEFKNNLFAESPSEHLVNDFGLYKDEIISYYKNDSIPPTIRINKKEDDPNNFLLEETNNISPQIYVLRKKTMQIYPLFEKIKNTINKIK